MGDRFEVFVLVPFLVRDSSSSGIDVSLMKTLEKEYPFGSRITFQVVIHTGKDEHKGSKKTSKANASGLLDVSRNRAGRVGLIGSELGALRLDGELLRLIFFR